VPPTSSTFSALYFLFVKVRFASLWLVLVSVVKPHRFFFFPSALFGFRKGPYRSKSAKSFFLRPLLLSPFVSFFFFFFFFPFGLFRHGPIRSTFSCPIPRVCLFSSVPSFCFIAFFCRYRFFVGNGPFQSACVFFLVPNCVSFSSCGALECLRAFWEFSARVQFIFNRADPLISWFYHPKTWFFWPCQYFPPFVLSYQPTSPLEPTSLSFPRPGVACALFSRLIPLWDGTARLAFILCSTWPPPPSLFFALQPGPNLFLSLTPQLAIFLFFSPPIHFFGACPLFSPPPPFSTRCAKLGTVWLPISQ